MIEILKKRKKVLRLSIIILLSLVLTPLLLSKYIEYRKYIQAAPYDVLVTDIYANSVVVSWKTVVDTNTYIKILPNEELLGDGESSKFHRVEVTGLKHSTLYEFLISDGEREWMKPKLDDSVELLLYTLDSYAFTTSVDLEEVLLPDVYELEVLPNELVYLVLYNKSTALYSNVKSFTANRFGGLAIDLNAFNTDWEKDEYEVFNINFLAARNIKASRNMIYAAEVNCNQSVSAQQIAGLTKEEFANLATRWVAGRGKNYAIECFNDVVYRSKMAGVDPAFTLALWLNESGASNYTQDSTQYGYIEDFGIHGNPAVPPQDFNAQINHFLKRSHTNSCPGLSPWEAWGNIYRYGTCNTTNPVTRQLGIDYYKQIEMLYRWITNGKNLPAKVTGLPIPVDIGKDSGNLGYVTRSICCGLKLDNKESFVGHWEYDVELNTCDDIWKPGVSAYEGTLQYSVEILDVEQQECESEYEGVCCKLDNDIKWYPKPSCESIVKDIYTNEECIEYASEKGCFFRNAKYQWLPKAIGYDNVKGVLNEIQCEARNTLASYEIPIKRGVNIIGFDFSPIYNADVLYASRLIREYPDIILVANFEGYEWQDIVKKSSTVPFAGQDFFFEQNKGYLIVSNEDITLRVDGWRVTNPLYSPLQSGWNLVGGKTYTASKEASTLINDLMSFGIDVDTVGVWSYELGNLIYRREQEDGEIFGENIQLGSNQGIFIRK